MCTYFQTCKWFAIYVKYYPWEFVNQDQIHRQCENVTKGNRRMNSKPTYFDEDYYNKDEEQAEKLEDIEVPAKVSTRGLRSGFFDDTVGANAQYNDNQK